MGMRKSPEDGLVADKLRGRYHWLNQFTDEELREISLCLDKGMDVRAGETYFDISHPERRVIVGTPGMKVPEGSCLVAESDVSDATWDKLVRTSP